MDFNGVPVSPASDAPPEVLEAFYRFVQQNPSLFAGKSIELNRLAQVPQQMTFRCPHCDAMVLSGIEECPNCKRSTRLILKEGQVVHARYRIDKQLARSGGFGSLYAVSDLVDGNRPLALKHLQHSRQTREKDRTLFEREGRLLAGLSHHSIPGFVEAFSVHGGLYLAMERIPGLTLAAYVHARGPLREDQVLALLPQMLEVLSYLHHLAVPVVHRDIKPTNFMLTEDDHLYLIDFGAATDPAAREREVGANGLVDDMTVVFTRGYSAPEVMLGACPQPASDLFSLGATLLNLLTARHPYAFYDPQRACYRTDDLGVSPGLRAIIAKLLRVPVAERYQDAEDVLSDLVSQGYLKPNA